MANGEPGEGVGNPLSPRLPHPDPVVPIMVYCGSGILCLNNMGFPSTAVSRFFVHEDHGSGGCSIKAERPEDLMLGEEGRVELGGAEEIAEDENLREKPVP